MDDFTGVLVAKDKIFPCIYGTKGFKANELDFVFLPSEDLNDIDVAKIGAKAILEYHKILSSRGRNISLVLMCPPPTSEKSVDQYHASFWSFLKRLRQLDPQPWPTKIPHDTSHQKWCMTFDNTEAFFAVLTPAHKQRLSRSAANFAMVYQPRYIFDVIFKDARYRESATKMVRELVDKFDQIPHSPDISDYGLNGTTESRQYFLLDENSPSASPYEDLDVAARDGYI
ncbi:YqcI/YcgG family-domain-containing protein [Pestalotiopsis sp. NC0098]|nr:YqcI/YcgG family-domain-containing protein [Pestalotiopsis sp. NC0098]